jgi:uncharacterized cupin superfamily protein
MSDDRRMERVNLLRVQAEFGESDPEGYGAGMARFGPSIGAALLGGTVYELPPGASICPYHYEYGDEEWLIALTGTAAVRHPGGEDELEPGDVVCFPPGPDGAHKVTNRTGETIRVLMLSTKSPVAVAVYPDSDKIGVFPGSPEDTIMVRRESGVGYWDREVPVEASPER